jgi:hypothetical protein
MDRRARALRPKDGRVRRHAPLAAVIVGSIAASPTAAHDWYRDLRQADGMRCCDGRDCRPVDLCQCAGGRECLLIEGRCVPIPWERVINEPSPDGRAHACWATSSDMAGFTRPSVTCVVLPGTA